MLEDLSDKPPALCDDWYCGACWVGIKAKRQEAELERQEIELKRAYYENLCAQLAQVVMMQDCLQWRMAFGGITVINPETMAKFRNAYGKENGYL